MKKRLFFLLFVSLFCLNDAFCGWDPFFLHGTKSVAGGAEAEAAWGNPYLDTSFIQDANRQPLDFRIKEGWACCTNLSWEQQSKIRGESRTEDRLVSEKDDLAIMAFIAKKIYEHGGLFCLTQLAATSSDDDFHISNQQPNWPQMPCVVLCEPGWDGLKCDKELEKSESGIVKSGQDVPCDTTDIAANIERIKQSKYEGNDSFIFHKWRPGTGDNQDFFARFFVNDRYEHAIYLGASEFTQHGVVAQPILVAVTGIHPKVTNLRTGSATSGKTKVLCAQGFTKNEMCEVSSKNCGSNVWCNGYSDSNFKSDHRKKMKDNCNIIVCKDRSKALDENFNCVEYDGHRKGLCEVDANPLDGKLVECGEGYVFNKDTCDCDKAIAISKDIMQYGLMGRNTDMVSEQCWTIVDTEKFKECVGIKAKKSE